MAISKLDSVYLFAPRDKKDELLIALQNAEIIHIEKNLREEVEEETKTQEVFSQDLESMISQSDFIIDYFGKYEKPRSITEQLEQAEIEVPLEDLLSIPGKINLKDLYNDIHDLYRLSKDLDSEEIDLQSHITQLEPYAHFDVTVSLLKDTQRTVMRIGSVVADIYHEMRTALQDTTDTIVLETIRKNHSGADYFFIAYPKVFSQQIDSVLIRYGFKEDDLRINSTAQAALTVFKRRIDEIALERKRIDESSRDKMEHLDKIRLMYDYLISERERKRAEGHLYETGSVMIMKGWIRKQDRDELERIVRKVTPDFEIIEGPPVEDPSSIPVCLENPKVVSPVEVVVGMYSLPKYKELDPTGFVFPFFLLFFGICMSDAGYGIILLAMSLVLRKYLPRSKFPKLMVLSSIATIIVGTFTGSFFGIPYDSLPPFFQSFSVDLGDHMNEFLVFALALGAIQMTFGIFVGAKINLMKKDWEKFTDSVLLGIFFGTGSPILLASLFLNTALPEPFQTILMQVAGYTAAVFMLFRFTMTLIHFKPHGTALTKTFGYILGIFLAIVQGALLSLFDATMKFFSNMLSYSRLMALGLAGSNIALVINMMALMVRDMIPIPILNIIIVVILLVLGHTINVLLNALVAFVHSARLQYVEFYPYFFEGGGPAFAPLAVATKYNKIAK